MSKRYVVPFVLIALFAFSFAAPAQDAAVKGPRLSVVEPLKNIGVIPKGDRADVTFEVKNIGTENLEILAVKPTCGCTVAEFDKVIKPGGTGKIVAHLETVSLGAGPVSKLVIIETNDPTTPTAQLTLTGMIKTFVESHPAGYARFIMLQGEQSTQSITLYTEEEEPFQIVGVEVPADYKDFVSVKYEKIEKAEDRVNAGREGQNQYRFDITTGGDKSRPGPLFGKILVKTNSKRAPEYPISLTGMIRPSYQVEPASINFGEVRATDESSSRTIALRSNRKEGELKVLKVDSTTKLVTTELKRGTQPGTTQIVVKVAPDAKGPIEGKLTIHTDDKANPTTEIQIRGLAKN